MGFLEGLLQTTSPQDAVMSLQGLLSNLRVRPQDCSTREDHPAPFLHSAVVSGDITDAAQFLSCQKIASAFPACTRNHYTHPCSTRTCSDKSKQGLGFGSVGLTLTSQSGALSALRVWQMFLEEGRAEEYSLSRSVRSELCLFEHWPHKYTIRQFKCLLHQLTFTVKTLVPYTCRYR